MFTAWRLRAAKNDLFSSTLSFTNACLLESTYKFKSMAELIECCQRPGTRECPNPVYANLDIRASELRLGQIPIDVKEQIVRVIAQWKEGIKR
jgi:hypothetical protein